jgi:hypothetical protein
MRKRGRIFHSLQRRSIWLSSSKEEEKDLLLLEGGG